MSIHLPFFTANNCDSIMQSAKANQTNYRCNLELAHDTLTLVNVAVRGDKRIGLGGREPKMLCDRVNSGQAMM